MRARSESEKLPGAGRNPVQLDVWGTLKSKSTRSQTLRRSVPQTGGLNRPLWPGAPMKIPFRCQSPTDKCSRGGGRGSQRQKEREGKRDRETERGRERATTDSATLGPNLSCKGRSRGIGAFGRGTCAGRKRTRSPVLC